MYPDDTPRIVEIRKSAAGAEWSSTFLSVENPDVSHS